MFLQWLASGTKRTNHWLAYPGGSPVEIQPRHSIKGEDGVVLALLRRSICESWYW